MSIPGRHVARSVVDGRERLADSITIMSDPLGSLPTKSELLTHFISHDLSEPTGDADAAEIGKLLAATKRPANATFLSALLPTKPISHSDADELDAVRAHNHLSLLSNKISRSSLPHTGRAPLSHPLRLPRPLGRGARSAYRVAEQPADAERRRCRGAAARPLHPPPARQGPPPPGGRAAER